MNAIEVGPRTVTTLAESSRRAWLVADGLGGYAMGTVAGLRTRRYHGLLVVATTPPGGRHLALAALDAILVVGDARLRLGTHRWADGTLAPSGFDHLASFTLEDGVPRWRFVVGDVVLDREVAMLHGRPIVAVHHRLVNGTGPVRIELEALCTWRDVHAERSAQGDPEFTTSGDGFVFEDRYRVRGPGFAPVATGTSGSVTTRRPSAVCPRPETPSSLAVSRRRCASGGGMSTSWYGSATSTTIRHRPPRWWRARSGGHACLPPGDQTTPRAAC